MVVILIINGVEYICMLVLEMLFLWVLRDEFGFIGIKFGCGVVVCGVCIVYLDGIVYWLC